MTGARRLLVLRHGETDHNASGVWQGQLDSALSARGREQAYGAAAALAAYAPVLVVASDLSRARDTGQVVAAAAGAPLETDERFREIHAGAWQGLTAAQVREDYPQDVDRLMRGEDFKRGGHGESVAEVAVRVAAGAADLLRRLDAGQTAVVATHGVAGRALVAELVGMPQSLAWTALAGLRNCRWAELVEVRSGWRLEAWNVGAPEATTHAGDVA